VTRTISLWARPRLKIGSAALDSPSEREIARHERMKREG
jgi:hypothetical protein